MQEIEKLAKKIIEIFIENYPEPHPGCAYSSKFGHYVVRVRELQPARAHCRRFDVTVIHRSGTVSALFERHENSTLQACKPQRLEWLIACIQRLRPWRRGKLV
jgi:hypothetical protein